MNVLLKTEFLAWNISCRYGGNSQVKCVSALFVGVHPAVSTFRTVFPEPFAEYGSIRTSCVPFPMYTVLCATSNVVLKLTIAKVYVNEGAGIRGLY